MATMGSWQPRRMSGQLFQPGTRTRSVSPAPVRSNIENTSLVVEENPSWSLKVLSQGDALSRTSPTMPSIVVEQKKSMQPMTWNPWSGSGTDKMPMSSTLVSSEFDTYGSMGSVKQRRKTDHHLFPLIFLTVCILIFAMPIYVCYKIGIDTDSKYWVGQRPLLAVLLLPIYAWVFILQRCKCTSKGFIFFCLCGSSVFLLAITDMTLSDTYSVILELNSQECSFDRKARLQESWTNAKHFYNTCTLQLSRVHGVSMDYALEHYRMEDCHEMQGYVEAFAGNPEWTYLEYQESSKQCMGWCERDWQLWSRATAKDSCSQVVGRYLKNYVKWNLVQVVLYSAVAVVLLSGVLTFLSPDIW